jgi:S-layer protein
VTGGVTVTGGSGKDVLTASAGSADTLNGGAGNDTLTSNGLASTLTGGAGSDKFVVSTVSAAKTIYTTITDFGAGDSLKLANMSTGTETFNSTAVNLSALASTASLSDALNTAINGTAAAQINWFQFGGNTYVVQASAAHSTAVFVDATDLVVKLTGLVDLSTAGFNADSQLLQA